MFGKFKFLLTNQERLLSVMRVARNGSLVSFWTLGFKLTPLLFSPSIYHLAFIQRLQRFQRSTNNMNFIKRVGSFAFSSWRDFSDYHHDQKTLDLDCSEDTQSDKTNISDIKIEKEGDDHVDDIIRRKPLHGFFKKRFSKKKLVVLDDPRSPTKEFERTLIQVESDSPNNGKSIDCGLLCLPSLFCCLRTLFTFQHSRNA